MKEREEGERITITNQTKKETLDRSRVFLRSCLCVSRVPFSFRHVSFLGGAFYSVGSRFVGYVRLNHREDGERSPNRTRPRPETLGRTNGVPCETPASNTTSEGREEEDRDETRRL